ncbi:MAG: hypothetical protein R3C13_02975 [Hyphomonas sp.]|uniref:hypothetical protein n=1 Tax=Hyphomonas sp. TaxID=87 RepID=UPI003529BD45
MKPAIALAATLYLMPQAALAQAADLELRLPLNTLPAADEPAETEAPGLAGVSDRPAMVIREDGMVQFLTTPTPARPETAAPVFEVDLETLPDGMQELTLRATGTAISDTATPDGTTRMIRIDPGNGKPPVLVTITKN